MCSMPLMEIVIASGWWVHWPSCIIRCSDNYICTCIDRHLQWSNAVLFHVPTLHYMQVCIVWDQWPLMTECCEAVLKSGIQISAIAVFFMSGAPHPVDQCLLLNGRKGWAVRRRVNMERTDFNCPSSAKVIEHGINRAFSSPGQHIESLLLHR